MPPKPQAFYAHATASVNPEDRTLSRHVAARGLFLRLGGCRYTATAIASAKTPFDLVTLLDQLELLRILDLQANGPRRAAQRHRLLLEVNLLYIGDEGDLFHLVAAAGFSPGAAEPCLGAVDPLAKRAAALLEGHHQFLGVGGNDLVTDLDLVEILDFIAGNDLDLVRPWRS
jgi:hypothetical protein